MFASQLGIDHAGADGVYGDAELAELFRGRARQSEKSGLRCRVVRTAERAHHPAGRGRDINDAAIVLGAHCRKNGIRHQERRGKVDLDHSTPFVGGEIGEACRQRKRGVVDEDVDPSEACERAARDLLGKAVRRDVARHSEGPLADFLRQRLGALPVADVHRDQGPALVQARCGSPSEAAPGTGDYSDASRKISVFHLESQDPIVADARDANAQNSNLFYDGGISAAYRERKWIAISASCVLALAITRKTGHIEIRQLGIVPLPHRRFTNGNSTKEPINIMKPKQIIISILAVLFVFPLMGTFAQQAASSGSIEVITTFDYPGAGNSTLPQKINERGDVVGEFIDSSGVTRGFVRFSDGSYSDPIVDPNDTVGFTEGRGINNSRTVAGDYLISDGTLHSFLLSGGTFTEYDVPGAVQTNLLSINDAASFTGAFDPDGSGILQAFVSIDGSFTSFSVPGAAGTFAYEINNSEELTVGYYIDGVIFHGYYRDSSGTLHFPIDPTGSTTTVLFGLNDRNWVVGRYAASGATHGLIFIPPNQFATFDYPGSTFTSLNGINDKGVICGRYVDASGIAHGFLARIKGTPPTQPMGPEMKANNSRSLVTPLNTSAAAWGSAMPAR